MLREVTVGYDLKERIDDSIYHNTRTLLELYPKVLWRVNRSLEELDEECQECTSSDLVVVMNSLIEIDPRINEARLKSRLRSIEDSKSILSFIDMSLLQLKSYPDNGDEYHDILTTIYIRKRDKPIDGLLDKYHVSRSTMYRKRNDAINMLGVILWGFLVDEFKEVNSVQQ
jgi:hypothetical protein